MKLYGLSYTYMYTQKKLGMGMSIGIVPILIPIPKYPAFLGVYAIPYPILKGCPNLSLFKINKNDLESVINSIFNYFYNTYLKILKPIYLLNIHLQRDNSSIGEIIPAILNIINKLEIIKFTPKLSWSCN